MPSYSPTIIGVIIKCSSITSRRMPLSCGNEETDNAYLYCSSYSLIRVSLLSALISRTRSVICRCFACMYYAHHYTKSPNLHVPFPSKCRKVYWKMLLLSFWGASPDLNRIWTAGLTASLSWGHSQFREKYPKCQAGASSLFGVPERNRPLPNCPTYMYTSSKCSHNRISIEVSLQKIKIK